MSTPAPGRRRRPLIIAAIVVAVLAVAAFVGPRIYAALQPDAPAGLSVTGTPTETDTGSATATATGPAVTSGIPTDGTWPVGSGSQAGYRIAEVLNGADVTVVGRTDKVTGSATIAGGSLTAATITVDVASIATDSGNRDNYFRENVMDVATHPEATFTLSAPVALPEVGAAPVKVDLTGDLTLGGTTKSVTATFDLVRDANGLATSGAIAVVPTDFGLTPPNLGFVKVEDAGTVEFLVHLTQP